MKNVIVNSTGNPKKEKADQQIGIAGDNTPEDV
jgi:hypothetical protein